MSIIDIAPKEPPKPGILKTLVLPVVIMLAVGGGAGFGVGSFFLAPRMEAAMASGEVGDVAKNGSADAKHVSNGAHDDHGSGSSADALEGVLGKVIDLAPVTVNLAVPSNVWMRLQIAVKTTSLTDEATLDLVHQDITAYVRQLRLDQLRSPNGYLRIRDDLQRRARIRSNGGISDLYVRTLVFE